MILEGEITKLRGGEALPVDPEGSGRRPRLRGWRSGRRRSFEEEFGPAEKSFGEGPFAAGGKFMDFSEELLGDLDLRLCHAGECAVRSI